MEFNATFIIALFSFVTFVFIMNRILYEPINNIIQKRNNFIDENLKDAKFNQDKKNSILKDRLNILNSAREEIKEEIKSKKILEDKQKEEEIQSALDRRSLDIKNSNFALENEKSEIKNVLINDTDVLSDLITQKLLEKI